MKPSIHLTLICTCQHCSHQWSIADFIPTIGSAIHCPQCGAANIVSGLVNGKGADVQGVAWLRPTVVGGSVEYETGFVDGGFE